MSKIGSSTTEFIVLVLSGAVLVLLLGLTNMTEPIFDHEKLDVYRLSIDYAAFSYGLARSLKAANRHARDQWLRAAQSVPLNIAEGNGKQSLRDKNRFFEIARGSALECAAIHDMLTAFNAIDEKSIGEIAVAADRVHVDSIDPAEPPCGAGSNRVRVRVPRC